MYMALLLSLSACNTVDSSGSDELRISIEAQLYEADDTVTIQIINNYSHDIFVHRQSIWSLQQKIDNEWKTIYAPIADTGPPRYSLFIEAGEVKELNYPALPNIALHESGHNMFRYSFGLLYEPDITTPLPEAQRHTPAFEVSFE